MSPQSPYYGFEDIKKACGEDPVSVFILDGAVTDARNDFRLRTQEDIKNFIYGNGLEDLEFQNSKPLESDKTMQVDAYECKIHSTKGYIAFFFSNKTKKWVIKSFKISRNNNPQLFNGLEKIRKQLK